MAVSKLSVKYNDYGAERSTVGLPGAELTAANFDAQNTAAIALMDAIAGITLGVKVGYSIGNVFDILGDNAEASDAFAQRETKWLVRFHEVTGGKPRTMEIPCADMAQLDPNSKGKANIGDGGVVDAFVSAFEAFVKTDAGGNVQVDEIIHVGRNI